MKPFVWLPLLVVLAACNGGGNGNSGNMSIVFTSSTLAARATSRTGTACNVTVNSVSDGGLCYTPISVSGYFSKASLGRTGGGAPVRILGGGTTVGLEGIFKKTAFDLKTPPTIPSSDDNIQDGTAGSYDILSLTLQGIEVVFAAEATPKYYHLRIPFVTTPPSSSSVYASCLSSNEQSAADEYGTLYGSTVAQAGDILVCIKTSATDTCADSDFQWVSSGALSATRPGSPERLTGSNLITAERCTPGADRPDVDWGYATLDVLLDSAVTVSAVIDGGTKKYTVNGVTGTKLTATLDLDTNLSFFVSNSGLISDLNVSSQSDVLTNIATMSLKPIYIRNGSSSPVSTGDMEATATLTVSD